MSFSGNYHVSDNMGELEVREESLKHSGGPPRNAPAK